MLPAIINLQKRSASIQELYGKSSSKAALSHWIVCWHFLPNLRSIR